MKLQNRKRRVSSYGGVALVILLVSPPTVSAQSADPEGEQRIQWLKRRLEQPAPGDVIVVAHRGCWMETAENSLAGIDRCVQLGVDMIEIDVRRSADGELVLMHDETVDRTTDGRGAVAELSLPQIRQLRLRKGAGNGVEPLSDERVPTLEEALRAAKDRVLVNLDIKEELYDHAFEIAQDVGSMTQIVIKMATNADDPRLEDAAFHGATYFMPIIRECTDDPARFCSETLQGAVGSYARYDPVAVEVVNHTDSYLIDGVDAVQGLNARLWVNTLPGFAAGRSDEKSLTDPDSNWGYLVNVGVNMIQTDRPAELLRYLNSRGLRVEH